MIDYIYQSQANISSLLEDGEYEEAEKLFIQNLKRL